MCTTLIVEDNTTFRQSLREMLASRFPLMSFDEAGNGEEALRKVDSYSPDLVFMDIKLPGVSGLEVTRSIKTKYSKMVVIILTSYDLPEYREAAYESGADYFLTKGIVTSDEINSLVQSLVGKEGADSYGGNGGGDLRN